MYHQKCKKKTVKIAQNFSEGIYRTKTALKSVKAEQLSPLCFFGQKNPNMQQFYRIQ